MIHTPHNKILFRYGEFSYLDPTYLYEYNRNNKKVLGNILSNSTKRNLMVYGSANISIQVLNLVKGI